MSRRLIGSIVGALAVAGIAAPVAHAGSPAKVTVRAEAPGRTLVSTTLTTTRTNVRKDDDATHTCSGTSAAGALEQATGGRWTANWFDGLGYAVDSIRGVKAPADFSAYWTLWINGRSSTTGVCDTELQTGDEVLEFLCTSTPDFSSCTNLPLELRAGRVRLTKSGASVVSVTVVRLKGDGTGTKVAGATVRGGVKTVTTKADGTALVELPSAAALRATHAGDVPSAPLQCVTGDGGGGCGSLDKARPELTVKGIRDGAVFAVPDAPRTLHGSSKDTSGVTTAFRLTRRVGDSCKAFDGEHGTFRACGKKPRPLFEIGDRARWSYLLPARLPIGSYTLVVRATDTAGNASTVKLHFDVAIVG